MDFKFRMPQAQKNDNFDKYRKVNKPVLTPAPAFKKAEVPSTQNQMKRSSNALLNKYSGKARKGKSSQNQFTKYFVELENVFYQERAAAQYLIKIKSLKRGLTILWVILFLTYLIIGRLKAYPYRCPEHATCGVFVNCQYGYELDRDGGQCVLKRQLIEEAEVFWKERIRELRIEYGEVDCSNEGGDSIPKLDLGELLKEFHQNKVFPSQIRIGNFLMNSTNQEIHGFKIQTYQNSKYIVPTSKLYSFSCSLKLTFFTKKTLLIIFLMIPLLLLILKVIQLRRMSAKSNAIYDFLEKKTFQEGTINVTHLRQQLETRFGSIDEEVWKAVNEIRTNKQNIGYWEDDFLYWRKA